MEGKWRLLELKSQDRKARPLLSFHALASPQVLWGTGHGASWRSGGGAGGYSQPVSSLQVGAPLGGAGWD